ncbi:MAG: 4Fe-4S binding protein [Deltaproteobacteria bacterium]|nr:4Fe-4S binding protein [Deltaproteobacteria bacterium]
MPAPDPLAVRPPRGGRLHTRRRALQLFTSLALILAPFLDLLRFDLEGGRLILFRTSFHLSEMGPIYALLLLCMLLIFAGALIYGRLWCGWMCPQTTLSELAATIERALLLGTKRSPGRKALSKVLILLVAAGVATSLISYFVPPARLIAPTLPVAVTWAVFFGILAFDLLWVRHDFCFSVCPYGILQGVVQDERTLGVTFGRDLSGYCVSCKACVRSCFMGIDIRESPFDPQCLNCGDCVDSINESHERRGIPLITGFAYGPQTSSWPLPLLALGIVDFRRVAVVVLIAVVGTVSAFLLMGRAPIDGTISPRFDLQALADGRVANHYNVSVTNHTPAQVKVKVAAGGVPGLRVLQPTSAVEIPAGKRQHLELILDASCAGLESGAHPITVELDASLAEGPQALPTRFFIPGKDCS